jgi:hypothetical protein
MNQKDLKKVIKQMVRESIAEIFVEMQLETIVEGVVKRAMKQQPSRVARTEAPATLVESVQPAPREELRSKIKQLVAPEDSEWASIYEDTAKHGNSILDGDDSAVPEVPESLLKETGLIRDFSKFIK